MSFQPSTTFTYIYIDSNDFAKVPDNKGALFHAVRETSSKKKINEYCRDYGFDDGGKRKVEKNDAPSRERKDMRVSNINYE